MEQLPHLHKDFVGNSKTPIWNYKIVIFIFKPGILNR